MTDPCRQSKKRGFLARGKIPFSAAAALLLFCLIVPPVFAGSDTWTGASGTAEWGSTGNWFGGSVPVSGNLATFDNAGNGQTTIDLGSGVTVNQIVFNTGSAAAYTIGTGVVGNQSLAIENSITVDATVGTQQTINANVTVPASGLLRLNGGGTNSNTVAGSISGSGVSIEKDGAGTWILSGSNTYDGGTTLTQGTLGINSSMALGTGSFTIADGTTIANTSGAPVTLSNNNIQIWNGSFTFSGPNNLNLGTGAVTLNATPTVTVSAGTTLTVGGNITGGAAIGFTKAGTGTLVLSGTNSWSANVGSTVVAAGTLQAVSSSALSDYNSSTVLVQDGATLMLGGSGGSWSAGEVTTLLGTSPFNGTSYLGVDTTATDLSYGMNIANSSGTLGLKKAGVNTLTLSGTNTYAGTTTISAGALSIASTGALPGWDTNGRYSVENGATLAVYNAVTDGNVTTMLGTTNFAAGAAIGFDTTSGNRSSNLTITDTGQGMLGFTKLGSNTLTLGGTNTYTGVTTLTAGTVSVATIGNGGVAGNLGQATNAAGNLVFNGGTLQYTGATASTDRSFTINTGKTATFEVTTNNLTISGASTATNGALTKTGNGTLTLSGTNLHTGATTITAGTLSVGASANLGNANSLVFNGGTLEVTGTSMTTFGTHTPTFSATKTVGLDIDNASNTFTVSQQLNQTTGGLTKSGSGILTLTNTNNTYTGTTTVSAGTLTLSAVSTNNISGSATINVASGATLNVTGLTSSTLNLASGQTLTGSGTVTGDLIIDTGSYLAPGSSPGTINTGNTTYDTGGTYNWELDDVNDGAGTGWDFQNITGTLTISATSGSPFTIAVSGAGTDFSDTSYYAWTIATASGGITGFSANKFTLTDGFVPAHTGTFGVTTSGNDLQVTYVPTGTATAYWKGDQDASWNTDNAGNTNWATTSGGGTDTGAVPGTSTDVYFYADGAGNLATSLGNDFTIDSLTMVGGAATSAVSIAAGNTLTINNATAITINSGAGALTMNNGVTLGSSQSWTHNGSNAFTVAGGVDNNGNTLTVAGSGTTTITGVVSDTGGLTKTGAGTLYLNQSANTYTGQTTIGQGTLQVDKLAAGGSNSSLGATAAGTAIVLGDGTNSGTLEYLGTTGDTCDRQITVTAGSAGTIKASDAGFTDLTLSGAVNNAGSGLTFDITGGTLTESGAISGSGGVTKAGTGTLVLSGVNSYTGTTTVNAGTFALGGGSAIADTAAVSLANASGAALRLDASETIGSLAGGGAAGGNVNLQANTLTAGGDGTDTAFAGVLSGTNGALVKQGAGTFTLTGTNTYTGTTTISAGTLQVGSGGTTGTLGTGDVTDNSALIFNRSDSFTVSNNISGSGTVAQNGSGTLTLSGTNSYTGTTTVNSGALVTTNLSGDLALAGTGALNLGTDTLTIGGAHSYSQGSGTTLNLTVDGVATFGHIVATGANATVNANSTINVTVGGTYVANGTTFKIVDGAGGANVNIPATITSNNFVIGFTGSVSNGDLILTLNRSGGDNAVTAGGNANEQAVWNTLQEIGQQGSTGDMLNVLNLLDGLGSAQELLNALASMTPDMSSGSANASRNLTGVFLASVSNRLGAVRGGAGVATGDVLNGTGIWAQGLGSNLKQDARQGIEGYQANVFGTTVGADKLIGRHVRVGLAGGYGFSDVNSKQPGRPSDDINSFSGIIYGSFDSLDLCKARQKGRKSRVAVRNQGQSFWYVDGMLGFTQHNYESRREIWLGSIKRVAKADHYAQQYTTAFEAGHTFVFERTRDLEITPFASLGYSYLYMNKYKERGADALDLSVRGKGYHLLEQGLGLKLAYPFIVKRAGTFVPSLKAAWLFDYITDRFQTEAAFAGGGPAFTTNGAKPARNGLLLGVEVAFLNKGNMTLTGNYDLQLKDEFISNTYYGTARLDF